MTHSPEDTWTLGGRTLRSRLIVGTGKYKDAEETRAALAASGAEIVTVALRRAPLRAPGSRVDALRHSGIGSSPVTMMRAPSTTRPIAIAAHSAIIG